jgi:ribosome-associated toxin RatA of RatAB toxin-antitoxin module
MRTVAVTARAPRLTPDDAFTRISDMGRYPDVCPEVRTVELGKDPEGHATSTWSVEFRDGILEWTERDVIDHEDRSLTFELVDGDLDHFAGQWRVSETEGATVVTFSAELDLGMASLAEIVDPMAQRSLEDSLATILRSVLGEGTTVVIEGR